MSVGTIVVAIVVVESIVVVVVRIVAVAIVVVVSVVISSLGFGLCFGLGVSFTLSQTGLFQSTDSATIRSDTIIRSERASSNSYTSSSGDGSSIGQDWGNWGCGHRNWVVNIRVDTSKGCRGSGIWKSSVSIDKWQSGGDLSISLTLVESVHMSVAVSGESISIGRTGIKSVIETIVGTITISAIEMGMSIVGTIKYTWVGFRLSLGKGSKGKNENYDQELHGDYLDALQANPM